MLEQKPNLSVKDACYLALRKFLHQPLKVTRELSENDQLNSETEKLIRNLLIPQNGDKGDQHEFEENLERVSSRHRELELTLSIPKNYPQKKSPNFQ